MSVPSVAIPDARDLSSLDVNPQQELASANHLLDDFAGLTRFYQANGYILLRDVLDPHSVAEARDAMFAVMIRRGMIEPGSSVPVWTGKPFERGMEESEEFSGIARRLIEHPENMKVMEKILGEPACMVPIVQYRTYAPGTPPTGVHQDGFFSPGIKNYKPVWMPMVNIEKEVGGLMLAVGQHERGYFHNLAKPPACPVPEGVIDPESWATTDYFPGDVLIIHPSTPHASMPNRSDRCRVSIDTRVQSAKDPRVLVGVVTQVAPDAIELEIGGQGRRRFTVDDQTFIRVLHPGQRIPLEDFVVSTALGSPLVVVFEGDRAVTLRRASDS